MIALGGPLWNQDDGVIAPMVALTLCATVAMAGLGTDFAIWYAQRRQLQAVTDAAALAASVDADDTAAALNDAKAVVQANGFDPSKISINMTSGYYCSGAGAVLASHFNANGCASLPSGAPDAVSVTAQVASRSYLLRALGTPGSRQPLQISTRAIATRLNQAGLAAGTGLLSVGSSPGANPSIVNSALQALLGTNVGLTAGQYNGLANANVDALSFLNALATRLHVTAGTYSQLLQTQASVSDVLGAAADVLAQQNQTAQIDTSGLQAISAKLSGNPQVTLGKLFDLGVWGSTPVGSSISPSALHAGLNVYQLATFSLQLANGQHAVNVPVSNLGILNLAGVTLAATAIEPPQQPYFAFGPVGMSVHTAQVRMQLTLQVLNLGGILGPGVQVPIYVEAGSGDAALSDISCRGVPSVDSTVKVAAQSALTRIYLGQAPPGLMANFQNPVPASSITPMSVIGLNLAGVGLATTTIKTVASIQAGEQTLTFYQPGSRPTAADPTTGVIGAPPWASDPGAAGIPARVSSGVSLASTLGSLASSMSLQTCLVQVGTICVGQIGPRTGAQLGTLFNVLSPLLSSLDGVIAQLQTALGAQIGYMDVQVTGVRCGRPVLIS